MDPTEKDLLADLDFDDEEEDDEEEDDKGIDDALNTVSKIYRRRVTAPKEDRKPGPKPEKLKPGSKRPFVSLKPKEKKEEKA